MSERISKELMQALMASTGLKQPTIYAKIAEIARVDGNSCSHLVYALEYAYQNGLNPKKFADKEILQEYKDYRRSRPSEPIVITKTKIIPEKRIAGIKFVADPDIPEINLPAEKVSEAKRMAGIYPYIYVLENSIRELIRSTLEPIHGTNWWDGCAPKEAIGKASERQDKQGRSRYYGTKAPHPIYLVDLDDLRNIIIRNWKDFEPKLPKLSHTQAWVINIIQMIEETRNIVAHNNPISKDDEQKLKVHFKDWANRIRSETT
jgi:hypothetical protein